MFVENNEIKFEIDKENHCAKVIGCSYGVIDVFIPRFIKYDSQEYPIKKISKAAFNKASDIRSANFPEDSEVQTIEEMAFGNGYIKKLYIPPSVVELEEGWCESAGKHLKVTISPNNKKFSNFNEDIIISKSDLQSDKFDTLFFACRKIKQVEIPPFIKKINPFAFSECDSLLHIKFSENSELEVIGRNAFEYTVITRISIPKHVKIIGESAFAHCTDLMKIEIDPNSELQTIEKNAFDGTFIEDLYIPSGLKELKGGWFNNMNSFKRIFISPKNEYYSLFEGKMIVGKSNKNDDVYDTLCYVPNDFSDFVVPPFIKKIDDYALNRCGCLLAVLFPKDSKVEIIGKYALPRSITTIRIPKSITTIDEGAFQNCNLKEIIFTDDSNLTVIGKQAFSYSSQISTSSITSICIPKHVKRIDDEAFSGCSQLKEVKFANDSELEIIGRNSFISTGIESIVIPKSVVKIDEKAFSGCTALTEIIIEEGSKLQRIGKSAFYKTGIQELTLPSSIKELEEGWCQSMNNLKEVKIETQNEHFKVLDNKIILGKSRSKKSDKDEYNVIYFACRNIKEVVIPSYIKEIDSFAFSDCFILKRITIEEDSQLEKICDNAFSCVALNEICIPKHVKIIDDFAFNKSRLEKITFTNDSELEVIGKKAFYGSAIKNVKIPNSVIEIKENAFSMCRELESFEFVDIQNSKIQRISDGMLSSSSIQSIAIPNSVRIIERSAFYNCHNLEKVDFTDDSQLTEIDYIAFSECPIKKLHIPPLVRKFRENAIGTKTVEISVSPKNEYLSVIDGKMIVCKSDVNNDKYDTILYALRNIGKATIPSYIKKIDCEAFRYCRKLNEVEFSPNSELEIIGKYSFDSSGLTRISIPDHVKIIDDCAFKSCHSLGEMIVTDKSELEIIGNSAFENCPIPRIFIPKTVKTIKNFAFCINEYGMSGQSAIVFPNDSMLENIGNGSFGSCESKSLLIPKHVKEIKNDAFMFSKLENIAFGEDSELEIIQDCAFPTCLESINFPSQLKGLGRYWAQYTQNLANIEISPKNQHFKYLDDKIIVYKSNDQFDTIVFALRDIEHAVIPSYIKRINPYAFAYCKELKSVEFEENSELEIIDDNAFEETSITKVLIPKKVKTIGKDCFAQSSLESITFPEDSQLNFIGEYAFSNTKIEKFAFPNRDILIQIDIFSGCTNIKEIVVSDSIESIYPFVSHLNLEKINIPPKVDDIKFIDFNYLKEIHISPNNKYFADIDGQMIIRKSNPDSEVYDIFYRSLKSIEKVIIPSYIKIINSSAFDGCRSIKSIEFAENSQLEIIEENAFFYSSVNKIDLPDTVKAIKNNAFHICEYLEKFEVPKNVESIEILVFAYCSSLQSVTFTDDSKLKFIARNSFCRSSITSICIPKHVKRIDDEAFNECSQLKEVKFANDSELEIIGRNSFKSTGIESIVIPKSVVKIDEKAFSGCIALTEIIIEEGSKLQRIGKSAFYKTGIQELTLPISIKELEEGWCQSMNNLKEVKIESQNEHFKVLDNKILLSRSRQQKEDESFDVVLFAPRDIEEIQIPSYIRCIGSFAFSGCSNLTRVSFEKDSKLEKMSVGSFSKKKINFFYVERWLY